MMISLLNTGKVRDLYVGPTDDTLLFVASDRISVMDVVLPTRIPDKGRILTSMSRFWFDFFGGVPNHLITDDMSELPPEYLRQLPDLQGRGMLVRKAEVLPVEFIVRGYLDGSGLKDYEKTGTIKGQQLPEGLLQGSKLPEPLFTPSTKAAQGQHDENLTLEETLALLGEERMAQCRELVLSLYTAGAEEALGKGIIIADTKFELGLVNGELTLIDEVLTPDSSRFWPLETYQPGRPQVSLDKQPVRDYAKQLGWNQEPPGPPLPDEVVEATRHRYFTAHSQLTGRDLAAA
jgi:phosphoribosylaminoimidazole-succinocarboxamide synthase